MVLTQTVMVRQEKAASAARSFVGRPWPGDGRAGPNARVVCRAVREVRRHNGYAVLLLVYEG